MIPFFILLRLVNVGGLLSAIFCFKVIESRASWGKLTSCHGVQLYRAVSRLLSAVARPFPTSLPSLPFDRNPFGSHPLPVPNDMDQTILFVD